jgi:carbohydrate binding protein with CBM4/9 domain
MGILLAVVMLAASPLTQAKGDDVRKAEAVLANSPDDAQANLVVGKSLAFGKEDWAAAIPHLAKGSDATLRRLAEKEASDLKTGPERVGMGDDWLDAAKKFPVHRKAVLDRAAFWYGMAWPDLDAPWRDRMRVRLQKMFQTPGIAPPKAAIAPKDWIVSPNARIGASAAAARSGKMSLQVVPTKDRQVVLSQSVVLKPGASYELSAWILTDGTESVDDSLYAQGFSVDATMILSPATVVFPDQPLWKKLSAKFTAPDNAAKMTVYFVLNSTRGTVFLDDISLMADGKESLKNGSFEEK